MKRTSGFLGLLCCATLGLSASCGADSNKPVDAGEDPDEQDIPCSVDYPNYEPGMTLNDKDAGLKVSLTSANPNPPRQQMANNWKLGIADETGTPLSDFNITMPNTYMPAHGHYGRTVPTAQVTGGPGQFEIEGMTFSMRGPWLVTFNVVPAGGTSAPVRFPICVD